MLKTSRKRFSRSKVWWKRPRNRKRRNRRHRRRRQLLQCPKCSRLKGNLFVWNPMTLPKRQPTWPIPSQSVNPSVMAKTVESVKLVLWSRSRWLLRHSPFQWWWRSLWLTRKRRRRKNQVKIRRTHLYISTTITLVPTRTMLGVMLRLTTAPRWCRRWAVRVHLTLS